MPQLSGYIDHIIFRNENNGYTVLGLEDDKGEITTLTGSFSTIEAGQYIQVEGEFTRHPEYGDQFNVKTYEIREPEGVAAIERYLASGTIKGIGPALAHRLTSAFGEDTFRVMEEEPERLASVKGISERTARFIGEQVSEKKDMRRAMMYLQSLGISPVFSAKIYAKYGTGLFEVMAGNPYQLVEDIDGIGFKRADEIAAKVGVSTDSPFRIRSGIIYSLMSAQTDGHMYLPADILIDRAASLLEVTPETVADMTDELIMESCLVENIVNGERCIYTSVNYYTELGCATALSRIQSEEKEDPKLFKKISGIEKAHEMELDEGQREAVFTAVRNGVSVITGGPGTGKTTIIRILLDYFDQNGMDVLLAAPTGRAAKRMSEATGYEARTIHRMLEVGGENGLSFGRNEDNPLETDVVIVDEVSMVDIFLFNALLKAVSPGTKLILVGDADQLPSVGPGSVLRDIIGSGVYPVAALTQIFRQAASSDIIVNAHKINAGQKIKMDNKSEDFFFLERSGADIIISSIEYLVVKKLAGHLKVKPQEIQVMAPMKKGPLGVENLNKKLQERLNPPSHEKHERMYGDTIFREGDKVMQVKNNYQTVWEIRSKNGLLIESGSGVFNGDIGTVRRVDNVNGLMEVVFDDNKVVTYQTQELDELELAYAITIHKSQGSEYPAVIVPLVGGPQGFLSRNLLYTAVTRAQRCVLLIGSSEVVEQMIANKNESIRYTGLKERIIETKSGIDL